MTDSGSEPGRHHLRRRFVLIIGLAVVVIVGAAFAAGRITSPRQEAADARPPAEQPITAIVQRHQLVSSVTFRADVVDVSPTPVAGPSPDGATPVVTALDVRAGQSVEPGEVLGAVAAEPVIVAQGAIPAFREMAPGTTGVDVTELQNLLTGLGLLGTPTGTYDQATSRAVTALFERRGFAPALTSPTADQQLVAAAAAVTAAETELSAATPATATTLRAALSAAQAAQAAIDNAQGAAVPLGEIAFVPVLPSRVLGIGTPRGHVVPSSGSLLSLGSGLVAATGAVDETQGQSLKAGQSAQVTGYAGTSSRQVSAQGAITAVSAAASTSGGSPQLTVTVALTGTAAQQLLNQNVAVRVVLSSSAGAVDIVPLSAMSSDSAGDTVVTVDAGGTLTQVPVTVLLTTPDGGGVEPTGQGLAAGDRVVLGEAATGNAP